MNRWLILVSVALLAGIGAGLFGMSRNDSEPSALEVKNDDAAGWRLLDAPSSEQFVKRIAAEFNDRASETEAGKRARRIAQRWIGGKPTSAVISQTAQRSNVQRWLNGVDRAVLVIDGSPSVLGNRVDGYSLRLKISPSLRSPGQSLSMQSPLDIRVQVQPGERRWSISGAQIVSRPKTGLGAVAEPIVVRRGDLDFVGEVSESALISRTSRTATAQLPGIRQRVFGSKNMEGTTVIVARDRSRARLLAGRRDDPQSVDAVGWTYETGVVVLLADELASATSDRVAGFVAHELAHFVSSPLFTKAPTVLLEGISVSEENRATLERTGRGVDLASLIVAINNRTIRWSPLFASTETDFSLDPATVPTGYLASFAIVGALGGVDQPQDPRFGRLLSKIRDGQAFLPAVRAEYGWSAAQLARETRTWAAGWVASSERSETLGRIRVS